MLNFKSNICIYGHNLLAYERNARGYKFAPGCKFAPGANLHPGANCAYEHGFSALNVVTSTQRYVTTERFS